MLLSTTSVGVIVTENSYSSPVSSSISFSSNNIPVIFSYGLVTDNDAVSLCPLLLPIVNVALPSFKQLIFTWFVDVSIIALAIFSLEELIVLVVALPEFLVSTIIVLPSWHLIELFLNPNES